MHCDFAFYVGGTHDNVAELAELETLPGCAGVKVFMGSSTGVAAGRRTTTGVEAILRAISPPRRLPLRGRIPARGAQAPARRRAIRPRIRSGATPKRRCARTRRLVALARKTGKRIHVLHISTAEEMVFLADHKDVASVEVTPHHLTLDETAYARLGTYAQMNPPVRDAAHRAGIWAGRRTTASPTFSAPTTRRIRREEKDHALSRNRLPA